MDWQSSVTLLDVLSNPAARQQALWWLILVVIIYLVCIGLAYLLTKRGMFACLAQRVMLTVWWVIALAIFLAMPDLWAYLYSAGMVQVGNLGIVLILWLGTLAVIWVSYPRPRGGKSR